MLLRPAMGGLGNVRPQFLCKRLIMCEAGAILPAVNGDLTLDPRCAHAASGSRCRRKSKLVLLLGAGMEISVERVPLVWGEMGEALACDLAHQRVLELAPARGDTLRHQRLELGARVATDDNEVRRLAWLTALQFRPVAFGAGKAGDVAAKRICRAEVDRRQTLVL